MSNYSKCRLCLKLSKNKIDIFKDDFPKMIEILTGIKVDPKDDLPNTSCVDCAKEVKSAMVTRKHIIKSHKILLEKLLTKQNKASSKAISPTSKHKGSNTFTNKPLASTKKRNTADNLQNFEVIRIITEINQSDSKEVTETTKSLPEVEIPEEQALARESHSKSTLFNDMKNECKTNFEDSDSNDCANDAPSPVSCDTNKTSVLRTPRKLGRHLQANTSLTSRQVFFVRKRKGKSAQPKKTTETVVRLKRKPRLAERKSVTRVTCDICQKEVKSTWLDKHLETHKYNPVTCEQCGVVSKNSISLRHHVFYYHKSTPDKYICDKCGKHFRSKYRMSLHEKKEHGGTKDFECTYCGKMFFENMHLKRHVNGIHKNLRPYVCDYCGKTFKKRTHLVVHWRIHTKEAPYSCHMCGENFKIKLTLRNHLKGVHNLEEEENVFCEICNKGFASDIALRAHSRLHDGQKCQHCSKIFSGEYMNHHLTEVHGVGVVGDRMEPLSFLII